jgi:hypothetical protein
VLPSDILFYKPLVRGVDYWTEADQESIVQQVITALGTPVFGRVDADNNIILSGALADGIYTIKYEDAEGNQTEIGTIEIGGVSYTNLADPTSEDWAVDKRLNSSAALVDATGCHTTNFFPCVKGDVIRVKGLDIRYTNSEHTQNARAFFYNAGTSNIVATYPVSEPKIAFDGTDMFTITLDGLENISGGSEEDVVKGRLSGILFDGYTSEDIIITVNQEISDSNGDTGETYTNWIPLSTEVDGVTLYNGGKGYKENTRWSSSGGGDVTADGVITSGYIPVKYGDIVRLKNIRMNKIDAGSGIDNVCNVCVFSTLGTGASVNAGELENYWYAVWDDESNLAQFTIKSDTTCYIRLNTAYIGPDSILTINEEITESGNDMGASGSIELLWTDSIKLDKNTGAESVCNHEYAASQHIELVDGYSYTFSQTAYGGVNICYYDAAGNGLGYELLWDGVEAVQSKVLTPKAGAATFRIRLYYGQGITVEDAKDRYSLTYEKTPDTGYTNLIPLSINADRTQYVGTNGEDGYKVGYRLNSSGAEASVEGENVFVTGFIPVAFGNTLYVSGMSFPLDSGVAACRAYLRFYDSSFATLGAGLREVDTKADWWFNDGYMTQDESGNLVSIKVKNGYFPEAIQNAAYVRISAYITDGNPIITVNEPIV